MRVFLIIRIPITVFTLLPRVFALLPRVFALLPRVFTLLPRVFALLPRVFALLPRVFTLLPRVFPQPPRVFLVSRNSAPRRNNVKLINIPFPEALLRYGIDKFFSEIFVSSCQHNSWPYIGIRHIKKCRS